jgi:adenylate kinase
MRIVLMGMPGVGKGTQAARLKEASGAAHVSTGDILREAVRAGTALGRRVEAILGAGELVPDELMAELIAERLDRQDARAGFVLDGYPRTAEQVTNLDAILRRVGMELDGVVLLVAPQEEIVRRLSGRRVCPACARVYHVETSPPRQTGVCDGCGSALVQREDDTERVIGGRLEVFRRHTRPVADLYRQRGLLREVDATGEPQAVFGRVREAVAS